MIKKISIVLWGLTTCLAIAGLIFLLAPGWLMNLFNSLGAGFGYFEPLPPHGFSHWNILSFGYMVLVSALAGLSAWDPPHSRVFLVLLAVGKITTSLLSLFLFFVDSPALIYLTTFLVDGGIVVLSLVCLWLIGMENLCQEK